MPETRQATASQSAELRTDMRETMRSELNDFFRSSEFKEILSKAVSTLVEESVQQATKPLLEKIEALEAELTNVRVQANENEQYSRKYNLRIVGLNENDGENCVGEVIKLCKEKLNVNVDERDIDRAHRLGPKALSGRSRTVIVKFKSYGAKAEICRQRKLLKGTQYYINEDLTKFNIELLNYARDQKSFIKSAWSADGKILVRNLDDKITRICQFNDFLKFNLTDPSY
ncbi:Hypothetical predicted protein [Paramuricea clavata]|uniref:Uncharacterized protein n=1 Tax=Paramuricea clavata TaxID=317549 RepID=A0A6S7J4G3_PARCT|nr:Hypothetical predicted protein [Paramuricea clavata]